jgi:protein-S-isoprenylcysteine O-methyltransferase Ste14
MKTNYFLKQLTGMVLFFSILFISAGRLNYRQGIIYAIIGLAMFLMNYTLLRIDPALLQERASPGEGTRLWDRFILGGSFLMTLAMFIVAGLDSGRYHWSPDFHGAANLAGAILTVSGQLLFLVAQKQNKFFSSTFRIQSDRGHSVCDTGLYKTVRHPAYLGSIIQALGYPLLMDSLWSIIPVSILIILFILRTHKEDQVLKDELNGYREYSDQVRFRIVPFVW